MINLNRWLEAVRIDLAELAEWNIGSPLYPNVVQDPSAKTPDEVPSHLLELYRAFDGLSLPDILSGLFIDQVSRAATSEQRGQPTVVDGDPKLPIHVFGSDGGSGQFAVGLLDGAVYFLDSICTISEGRYFEDVELPIRRVAANANGFLVRLKEDIHAFVHSNIEHRFTTDYVSHMGDWLKAVRKDLANLPLVDPSSPLDPSNRNEIRESSWTIPTGLPYPLWALYCAIDGLSLPDVYKGYFIDTATRVATASERGEQVVVGSDPAIPVQIFGHDGVGGRFAVGLKHGIVYYLPCGYVKEGKHHEDYDKPARRIAAKVHGFLDLLRDDIHAFVQGDLTHKYIVDWP